MAQVNPLKLVYDNQGNPIALSELQVGDSIPAQYLMLDASIDGGAITDVYRALFDVDGGLITDNYPIDNVAYDAGQIVQ